MVQNVDSPCTSGKFCNESGVINTITLDDLLPLLKTRRALIKADVQSHEIKVFSEGASLFFASIDVPVILMEWEYKETHMKTDGMRAEVDKWLETFFYRKHYSVYNALTDTKLTNTWGHWPHDIKFVKDPIDQWQLNARTKPAVVFDPNKQTFPFRVLKSRSSDSSDTHLMTKSNFRLQPTQPPIMSIMKWRSTTGAYKAAPSDNDVGIIQISNNKSNGYQSVGPFLKKNKIKKPSDESTSKLHPYLDIIIPSDVDFQAYRFDCVITQFWQNRSIPMCLYTATEDKWISSSIYNKVPFEFDLTSKILRILKEDPGLALIDLGANLGLYTLSAAHTTLNQIIAVEPNMPTMARLSKSALLGNITDRVTLVWNAVSNNHTTLALHVDPSNRGDTIVQNVDIPCTFGKFCRGAGSIKTITLDDLLPLLRTNRTLIKADVQSHEINVFAEGAIRFFESIHVPIILMEWEYPRRYTSMSAQQRSDVTKWLETFFYTRNYIAYNAVTDIPLNNSWPLWPHDIILRRNSVHSRKNQFTFQTLIK